MQEFQELSFIYKYDVVLVQVALCFMILNSIWLKAKTVNIEMFLFETEFYAA